MRAPARTGPGRPAAILTALAAAAVLAACLPIPVLPFGDRDGSRRNVGDEVPLEITVGKTTRAEVLLALGEPDWRKKDGSGFLYVRQTEEGGIAFLVGGYTAAWVVGTPITVRTLTFRFDANGVVAEAKAEKRVTRDAPLFEPPVSGESWPANDPP